MKTPFMTAVAMAVTLPAAAQSAHWTFSESTGGGDVEWYSSTSVETTAAQYDYSYDITYIAVDVVFVGSVWGPYDITGDVDPEFRHGEGLEDGPLPVTLMDQSLEGDGDGDGSIDISAHMFMEINGKGRGHMTVTDVWLGTVIVDMGWPFGDQEVQLDRVYMDGAIDVTPITPPCTEDVNGDTYVDVTDLLEVIANWGEQGGPSDVTGDGTVNVSDLLAIVAAWGPCA